MNTFAFGTPSAGSGKTVTKQTRFLVVDDFEPMRKVTADQLRKMGAQTILMAGNGAEALKLLRQQKVDMVLSDWNMPVMNGLDLLKAIRADEKLAHLPVVMITAEAERNRIMEAVANGVSDLLVKPYTVGNLQDRVQKALNWLPRQFDQSPAIGTVPVQDRTATDAGVADLPKSAKPTILVVDDTPDNLHLLSSLFNDEYRVRIAHNGGKALAICQSDNPPDLVLLDVMMPDMDGFEVAKRMREHPSSETIPVIFVTSMDSDDARMKGLELGAVDFVTKPINPTMLQHRVRNFIRYVELRKQLQADYDAMQESAKLREDVEHITRHDLKGPLAGVIGIVQSLSENGNVGRKELEQLRMVEEAALQTLNMVNLTSELYKIETGRFQLDPKPIKIGDLLRRIVELTRTTFKEKQLTISVDTDVVSASEEAPQILGDAMLCYSLFQNLIKNACEAAPDKTRVDVSMTDESPMRILVRNKKAVPLEIRSRFFDKFATYGKNGGTGLGTYSARLLTEAQAGTIALTADDDADETIVTVTLPRYGNEKI
jgi:two-component system, sensor histidine kinase and response regulator